MDSQVDSTHAIERIYREEYGRIVASLTRRFGDIDIAEEAAGEALLQRSSAGRGTAYRPTPEAGSPRPPATARSTGFAESPTATPSTRRR